MFKRHHNIVQQLLLEGYIRELVVDDAASKPGTVKLIHGASHTPMCQRRKYRQPAQFQGAFWRLGPPLNPFSSLLGTARQCLFAVLANYPEMQATFDIGH